MPLALVYCLAAAAALPSHSIRIGNFFTSAPNGIALVVDDKAGLVLDPGGAYYAGVASPDDSYHRTQFDQDGARIVFEWGRVGDAAIGRLTADHPVQVHFDLTKNWPGFSTRFSPGSHGVDAFGNDGVRFFVRSSPDPSASNENGFNISVAPSAPAYLELGTTSSRPEVKDIDQALAKSSVRYTRRRPSASGAFGDFLGAIADNLNNSRVYSTDNHLEAITVSRGWAPDPNSAPYFCWDSFFNGLLACIDDPVAAKATVRAILGSMTPDGFVPNYAHWKFPDGRSSLDRSQPPVGSMCVWKMHQRRPDVSFLREVYPLLLRWHRWWPTARDGRHDGLLEWGSSKHGIQEALWETGWDDTIEFVGAQVAGNTLDAYAVDLNSLWAMDAEYLALIADKLGHKWDAVSLRAERARTARLMNEKLWNPDLGIYCSRLWSGRFLTRLTPMNFYPLIAGVPDAARAKQVLAILTDPKRFWGEWVLPTVAYDDPVYHEQDYWRGKVWAPVDYLVFQGLLRYASSELLNEYAAKCVTLFMRNWTAKNVCGENYLSTTGLQSSDAHYTWGALLCLVQLENTCAILPDGRVRLNGTFPWSFELRNVPFEGKDCDLSIRPGRTTMKYRGRVVLQTLTK